MRKFLAGFLERLAKILREKEEVKKTAIRGDQELSPLESGDVE